MASTYSSLKIQLMATGENSGTWGNVTNVNLGTAIEEAIVGSADVPFSNADVTLTLTDTNATQTARNLRLNLTGTAATPQNLIVPAIEKIYIINNGLASAVTVKVSGQTGISVPAGKTMYVYNNGTDCVDAITHLTSLTLASPLPIASGGTGSATATFNGENITSINASNISSGTLNDARLNTVTVAKGGTGATTLTAEAVIIGNTTSNVKFVSPGTAGNVLASNGTSWVSQAASSGGFSGGETTTTNANITLTNSNGQTQVIKFTAAGLKVTLPNAETIATDGTPAYMFYNNSGYPFTVNDAGGSPLALIATGASSMASLVNNSTSNGTWQFTTQSVNKVWPGLLTSPFSLSGNVDQLIGLNANAFVVMSVGNPWDGSQSKLQVSHTLYTESAGVITKFTTYTNTPITWGSGSQYTEGYPSFVWTDNRQVVIRAGINRNYEGSSYANNVILSGYLNTTTGNISYPTITQMPEVSNTGYAGFYAGQTAIPCNGVLTAVNANAVLCVYASDIITTNVPSNVPNACRDLTAKYFTLDGSGNMSNGNSVSSGVNNHLAVSVCKINASAFAVMYTDNGNATTTVAKVAVITDSGGALTWNTGVNLTGRYSQLDNENSYNKVNYVSISDGTNAFFPGGYKVAFSGTTPSSTAKTDTFVSLGYVQYGARMVDGVAYTTSNVISYDNAGTTVFATTYTSAGVGLYSGFFPSYEPGNSKTGYWMSGSGSAIVYKGNFV